jgi:hypothetical protein
VQILCGLLRRGTDQAWAFCCAGSIILLLLLLLLHRLCITCCCQQQLPQQPHKAGYCIRVVANVTA